MTQFIKKIFALIFIAISAKCYAVVDPPNFYFKLDDLELFSPELPLAEVEKKFGKGLTISIGGYGNEDGEELPSLKILQFSIKNLRYHFPIFVQVYREKIIDFFAVLPTYFLHDIFLQSLINKFGANYSYTSIEQNGLYVWKNMDNEKIEIIYSGTCTITCFPLYFSLALKDKPADLPKYKTLLQLMGSGLLPNKDSVND